MKTIKLPDGRELKYELTRKRVKNVNMRIKADGVVYISANTRIAVHRIEELLIGKAEQILKAAEHLNEREQRSEISSEKMSWLGMIYPVRVIHNSRECVILEEAEFRVYTTHPDKAEELLLEWAYGRFSELVTELNAEVRNTLIAAGVTPPPTRLTIKDMKTRWGSCSYTRGHISINFRLMAYPRETTLSVLWHEYSHYWHHDHSDKFYAFLESFFPEYRKWNGLLK